MRLLHGKLPRMPWEMKKDQSIEDVLKQQIQKQEYHEDGGGKAPRGWSGGGSGDGFGEADEEGLSGIWDEFVQGEEVTVLAKEIKFLFTRQASLCLARIISEWKSFFAKLNEKEVVDPYWLEREIINTTAVYDSPEKFQRILYKAYLGSKADDDEGYNNFG